MVNTEQNGIEWYNIQTNVLNFCIGKVKNIVVFVE